MACIYDDPRAVDFGPVERALDLAEILRQGGRPSVQDVAERYGISERQARRLFQSMILVLPVYEERRGRDRRLRWIGSR